MTRLRNDKMRMEWLRGVGNSIRTHGYYYEPEFCADTSSPAPLLTEAELLGSLYVPSDATTAEPIIHTQPSPSAPAWRPFDRRLPIRWHNDFSTRAGRPELSLSWIRQEDPIGPDKGAWWVASSAAVIAKLLQSCEGKRIVGELSERAEPFGYRDAGGWRPFRVIIRANDKLKQRGLRFYGRALEDGSWLRFGRVAQRTLDIVARIEEAADSVREVLPARTGSLLIVHNSLSLHDRSPQTVSGPATSRRQAILCFVQQIHPSLVPQ